VPALIAILLAAGTASYYATRGKGNDGSGKQGK